MELYNIRTLNVKFYAIYRDTISVLFYTWKRLVTMSSFFLMWMKSRPCIHTREHCTISVLHFYYSSMNKLNICTFFLSNLAQRKAKSVCSYPHTWSGKNFGKEGSDYSWHWSRHDLSNSPSLSPFFLSFLLLPL